MALSVGLALPAAAGSVQVVGKPDPAGNFSKARVAGKSSSWQGDSFFDSLSFGIPPKSTATRGVDLVRRDIMIRKYVG